MADYLVGDIHGSFAPLDKLLNFVDFDTKSDRLWSVGDLVNRGKTSLKVLRYFYQNRKYTRMVLGNHDIHLLVVAAGIIKERENDTLKPVLKAKDRDEMLDWLRKQPLLSDVSAGSSKGLLVHAGIPPQWDAATAHARARELEQVLQDDNYTEFLKDLYGDEPTQWHDSLRGVERLRIICNYFTRMRFCAPNGDLDVYPNTSKFPFKPPAGMAPWYVHTKHACNGTNIFFGHWAAVRHNHPRANVYALDGAWIWGGELRLLRLDDMKLFECRNSGLVSYESQIESPLHS